MQSYTDCNGDINGCCFSNSDLYGYSYGYSYSYGTFSDSDLYGCGYGNANCNRDAHAAAYPDAETGSDTIRAYGRVLFK